MWCHLTVCVYSCVLQCTSSLDYEEFKLSPQNVLSDDPTLKLFAAFIFLPLFLSLWGYWAWVLPEKEKRPVISFLFVSSIHGRKSSKLYVGVSSACFQLRFCAFIVIIFFPPLSSVQMRDQMSVNEDSFHPTVQFWVSERQRQEKLRHRALHLSLVSMCSFHAFVSLYLL